MNPKIAKTLVCFFILLISFSTTYAEIDTIVVQLKWKHQFQFSGYYAAQKKGFYQDENIYVKFRESDNDTNIADQVVTNNADFGVAGSDVILDFANNKPVAVLASIFQHSPYVIISRKEKKITKPTDLVGKTIYASKIQSQLLIHPLLKNEGIPLDSVKIISSKNTPSLLDDEVDGIMSYKSGLKLKLEAKGLDISTIDPADYGVDFYGDILITSKAKVEENPELVQRFLAATLKGWDYALKNHEEISDYILTLPGVISNGINKDLLLQEAKMINSIVRPDVVEIGHINKGRWENILKSYKELGAFPKNSNIDLKDFIYEPEAESYVYIKRLISISSILLIVALFFLIRNILIKLNLARAEEKVVEATLKDKLSKETINTILEHTGIILWNWNVVANEFEVFGGKDNQGYETKNITSINAFKDTIHPDTVKNFDLFTKLLPSNFSEEVLVKINNKYDWFMLTAKVREVDENEQPTSFLGLLIDISSLKKKEENLDNLTKELGKTNSELQKFAYITSHNLRAPVVNLGSLIEFYDFSSFDKYSNNEIVEKMGISVDQLKKTLDDLIEVVSKKNETQYYQIINLQEEIEKIANSLKLKTSHLECDFSHISQIEFPLKAFHTIFTNILSNCLKYKNPDKALIIKIKVRAQDDDFIAIDVIDNGLGIDLDKNKEKMFGLYQRFHPKIEGRGIGLFIVKSQMESLDGKIEVKSDLNIGTTFTLYFRRRVL